MDNNLDKTKENIKKMKKWLKNSEKWSFDKVNDEYYKLWMNLMNG